MEKIYKLIISNNLSDKLIGVELLLKLHVSQIHKFFNIFGVYAHASNDFDPSTTWKVIEYDDIDNSGFDGYIQKGETVYLTLQSRGLCLDDKKIFRELCDTIPLKRRVFCNNKPDIFYDKKH